MGAWGQNDYKQLGDETTADKTFPVLIYLEQWTGITEQIESGVNCYLESFSETSMGRRVCFCAVKRRIHRWG
jgi:hypothetical protein